MVGVGVAVSCPRCGGPVRPPDLLGSDWRCHRCGPVTPLRLPGHIDADVLEMVRGELSRDPEPMPLWCPWPLPTGWTVTAAGWAGDDRSPVRGTVLACGGPAPLTGGPADLVLVAETPGLGLASRYAGLSGVDPGPVLTEALGGGTHQAGSAGEPAAGGSGPASAGPAKVRVGRHPAPLWAVPSAPGRSAYVGEAKGVWLVAVGWPPATGYLLADDLVLWDLMDWSPPELVYGARSARVADPHPLLRPDTT